MRFLLSVPAIAFLVISSCATDNSYPTSVTYDSTGQIVTDNRKIPPFGAYFSPETNWNGLVFPAANICEAEGSNGESPAIMVENIPVGTTDILVEFSNISRPEFSGSGALGIIGYRIPADTLFYELGSVSSRMTETDSDIFMEKSHSLPYQPKSAYFAPCKNWIGDSFSAIIKAVRKSAQTTFEEPQILAVTKIELGKL